MGTNKVVPRTSYCRTSVGIDISVAYVLDELIAKREYEQAIEYIKSYELDFDSETILVNCVNSYKNSC